MGSEALSKVMRRDLRRAYAPEASEEVLKFVAEAKGWLSDELAKASGAQHNVNLDVRRELDAAAERMDAAQRVFVGMTFVQRLRWLVTGRWLQ